MTTTTATCTDCGTRPPRRRGLCSTCCGRRERAGIPLPPTVRPNAAPGRTDAIIEDATFLATTGAGLTEAAHRTGTTPIALEALLYARRLDDVLQLLRMYEPLSAGDLSDLRGVRGFRSDVFQRGPVRGTWKVA